jgi:hypothetical protein
LLKALGFMFPSNVLAAWICTTGLENIWKVRPFRRNHGKTENTCCLIVRTSLPRGRRVYHVDPSD